MALRRWSARAFGLTVRGDFEAPGLDGRREPPGERTVAVRLASAEGVAARAGPGRETRCERRDADGALVMRIDRTPEGAHLIEAPGHGTFLVAADGGEVLAAPARCAPWRWQRYLIGQALPLAAVLQGIEVLHASAVVVDHGAVAVVGGPCAGKSTLAAAMLRTGARLLCDDVLALEPAGDRVRAHPGPPVINLRAGGATALGAPPPGCRELGRDAEATRLEVDAGADAAPLTALYVLHRSTGHARLALERRDAEVSSLLLASSFNFIVTDAARLERQLDVCARVARTAALFWARVPARMEPLAVARAIEASSREVRACAA